MTTPVRRRWATDRATDRCHSAKVPQNQRGRLIAQRRDRAIRMARTKLKFNFS
jgi:hypothetical protein